MKLVTYAKNGSEQLAFFVDNKLYDTNAVNSALPSTMTELLNNWETLVETARKAYNEVKEGKTGVSGME